MDSVEDIDVLTYAIHEAMFASAPKSEPAKQLLVSIPRTILANIREKNRLGDSGRLTGTLLPRIESIACKGGLESTRPCKFQVV